MGVGDVARPPPISLTLEWVRSLQQAKLLIAYHALKSVAYRVLRLVAIGINNEIMTVDHGGRGGCPTHNSGLLARSEAAIEGADLDQMLDPWDHT